MNSLSDTILSLLLNPNIIFLLFIIALMGVFVEVSHPGGIIPGVVGSIALILFLLGAWLLSPNWAGLVFMTLAFVLLLLDVKLPAHGILTLGAVISLIAGAFLFFNGVQSSQGSQLNPILVFAMGGLVGLVGLYIVTLVVRTRRRSVKTGTDSMIGATVIASTPLQPVGRVNYKGEDWTAILDDPSTSVDPGTELQIVEVEGLLVHVQPDVDKLSDSAPIQNEGS
jgi:membrane-bound serine protease (ClpP class)